ncbi:MAG: hypothetical protein KDK34_03310, partial [Leptospiraceae bacterium]|nr:hypothetical protein [Leptospiraceae bacterium]
MDTAPPAVDCPPSPDPIEYPAGFDAGPVGPNTTQSPVIDPTVPLVLYEQYFDDGAEHDAGMTGDADGCMNNLADCLNRLDRNDGTWTITAGDDPPNFYLENTGDYLEVIDASQLEAADLDDRLCFETLPIDIRGMPSVSFSLKMFDNSTRMPDGSSGLESDDGFDVSYSIDGGATFELPLVASVRGGFDPTTVVKDGIAGDDLVIRVCFFSTGGGDKVALDDVIVTRSNAPVNVTDNCDASPEVSFQDVAETFGPCQSSDQLLARVTRTWIIADDCGNATECAQVFNFVDSTPPTADCPVSPEIQECPPGFNTIPVGPNTPQDDRIDPIVTGFPANVWDNYTASPSVEYRDAIQFLQCQVFGDPVMQATRTWTITDDCGNALECIQVFRYTDTMAPTAECPLSPEGFLEYPVSLSQTPVGPNTPQDDSIDPSITG